MILIGYNGILIFPRQRDCGGKNRPSCSPNKQFHLKVGFHHFSPSERGISGDREHKKIPEIDENYRGKETKRVY